MASKTDFSFPSSQAQLVRLARGTLTQKEFARRLRIAPSSVCRYESEQIGASVKVINHCLKAVAAKSSEGSLTAPGLGRAIRLVQAGLSELEGLSTSEATAETKTIKVKAGAARP